MRAARAVQCGSRRSPQEIAGGGLVRSGDKSYDFRIMCGIVGYVGAKQATPILIGGLRRLEYRGYDSAGVAVVGPRGAQVLRCRGKLAGLEAMVQREMPEGTLGIGHTRWATHGRP